MGFKKRVDLEAGQLFIYLRDDVGHTQRWYVSYKLKGVKRIYKSLGIMSEVEASKKARRELANAEDRLELYGANTAFSKNTVGDAFRWFKENGENYVGITDSSGRYKTIMSHWDNHLLKFFGSKTVIDERLQSRMGKYVEYRRRVINKKTGERLHAKISSIKNEITCAKQLLLLARQKGIGGDVGNLTLELSKSKLRDQRSKSTTFTAAEVEDIKSHFDREAKELETLLIETHQIVDSASLIRSRSARTAARRLFLLERLRFFVAVCFASGCRVNEARQIRHSDFGDDFQTVKIRRSKTAKGSNRTAFLDNEIWDIEAAYTRYMRHAKTTKSNSLVFADEEGMIAKQESGLLKVVGKAFRLFLKRNKMLVDKKYGREKRNFYSEE
jgi:integrase